MSSRAWASWRRTPPHPTPPPPTPMSSPPGEGCRVMGAGRFASRARGVCRVHLSVQPERPPPPGSHPQSRLLPLPQAWADQANRILLSGVGKTTDLCRCSPLPPTRPQWGKDPSLVATDLAPAGCQAWERAAGTEFLGTQIRCSLKAWNYTVRCRQRAKCW